MKRERTRFLRTPRTPRTPEGAMPRLLGHRSGLPLVLGAVAAVAGLLAVLSPAAADAPPGAAVDAAPAEPPRWPKEAIDFAATIPIQNGGRVKPLHTYAGYTLLGMNHRRTVEDPWKRKLEPLEWLLDVLLRPEVARKTACFMIENDAILDAVGLPHEKKKKRDRYSYEELSPARAEVRKQAAAFREIAAKDRDPVQGGVVDLAHNLSSFESLLGTMEFARTPLALPDVADLKALFPDRATVTAFDVALQGPALRMLAGPGDPHGDDHAHGAPPAPQDPGASPAKTAATALRARVSDLAQKAATLAIVPPAGPSDEDPEWITPGHILYARSQGIAVSPDHAAILDGLAALQAGAAKPGAEFTQAMERVHDGTVGLARGRGEYGKIEWEVRLARLDPFYNSVHGYLWSFLFLLLSLVIPAPFAKWLRWGAIGLLLASVAYHTFGIAVRCYLRERPPITTLYETALFVSAAGAIACLVAETLSKKRIALAMAPIVGGLGLFIANRYETLKGEDTMPQLVAVLDTNFWLATHVTCITIGYTGGLLAALVAHIHVLGRTFGLQKGNEEFYRSLTRMTYGMLAFGLVFSVVGTILGGIWANESWGRFWGWDPKENGALLICLAQVAILHARMGGLLKPYGVALATIAQGCVVAFSWWGVNLLGIGLHSYGFTGGIWTGLLTYYLIELLVIGVGFATWLSGRAYLSTKTTTPA